MNTPERELLIEHLHGRLPPEKHAALNDLLRRDTEAREWLRTESALETRLRALAVEKAAEDTAHGFEQPRLSSAPTRWLSWRPLTAAAAGLVIGLFSASLVLAVTSPKATTERLFSLVNGSFDDSSVGHGFPHQIGGWSGDDAAIADGKLQFVAAEGDAGDPGTRAIACDVFQLVDLRPLKTLPRSGGEIVLELSASFLDARPANTNPSVTFFCQLYLFQGDPAQMHQTWPKSIPDALASSSAQATTLGRDAKGGRILNARCLLPGEADFAVAQLVARPNLRPTKLEGLFADDVKLTLKTAPELPVRIVQR
jgi:hypothetical protein